MKLLLFYKNEVVDVLSSTMTVLANKRWIMLYKCLTWVWWKSWSLSPPLRFTPTLKWLFWHFLLVFSMMTNIEARFLHDDQHWDIDISAYDWNHRLDLICKVSENLDKKNFLKNLSEKAKTWLFEKFWRFFPRLSHFDQH